MPSLKQIVERADTKAGRTFQFTVQLLIIFSLVTFSIETLPNLSPALRWWLWAAEVATVAIFTFEYLLRLYVADKKFGYVFSFFGMVDLLAILPFYISTGIDLRAIRAFRFVRMFRLLKLARYGECHTMPHLNTGNCKRRYSPRGQWHRAFLDVFRECGSISDACKAAGIHRRTVYRAKENNPQFAADFDLSRRMAIDALLDEAHRRGVDGWEVPVPYRGKLVGYKRRYSDGLLIFLLKWHMPEKWGRP